VQACSGVIAPICSFTLLPGVATTIAASVELASNPAGKYGLSAIRIDLLIKDTGLNPLP
jgi:hypothetical protein